MRESKHWFIHRFTPTPTPPHPRATGAAALLPLPSQQQAMLGGGFFSLDSGWT